MRSALLLYLLPALLAAAPSAGLREVLHPRSDLPAFRSLLPDGWTSEVDAAGNLLLANRDRSANFSLGFVHSPDPEGSLDALAKAILASAVVKPWDNREPAEISGHRGYRYTARVRHTNGVEVRTEVVLVAVGTDHIAACSLLLGARVSRADETTARLMHAAVRLLPAR